MAQGRKTPPVHDGVFCILSKGYCSISALASELKSPFASTEINARCFKLINHSLLVCSSKLISP